MSSLVWDKGGEGPDERLMRFLAGEDVLLDQHLIRYDVQASKAHVGGLERIGALTVEERDALTAELDALDAAIVAGEFVLDARFEDCHSAIEAWLIDRLGDAGKKVHTGRSRNDQVLVAQRLFLRDALAQVAALCEEVAEAALARAEADAMTPMPGYTHLQRAVPSSVGMWMAGFAEAFVDNAALAHHTLGWINANPLGTAAGYGVNLPLDRDGVTEALGFERLQINPIYTQNSRGKFELQALMALGQALLDVRRLAWDLSLYTTAEFGFVTLPTAWTTGSSIMPNKRNPDVVELLRAAWGVVPGAMSEIEHTLSLPSGYHRDLQNTKGPVLRAFKAGLQALGLVAPLLGVMQLDRARMAEAISPELFATDHAIELTAQGVPFREAYRQVAASLDALGDRTADASLSARTSPGACAALRLDALRARLNASSAEHE